MVKKEAGGAGEEAARLAVVSERVARDVTDREILLLHRLEASMR
jgi:hypothetical protein